MNVGQHGLSARHRGLAEGARDCVAVSSKAKVEETGRL